MIRRRTSTADLERLAKATQDECAELIAWLELVPPPQGGPPSPPMSDPGTGPGWSRRYQAKHDLAHWRQERERLMYRLGHMAASGQLVNGPLIKWGL